MIEARSITRCAWCMETETTIARQVFRIERLMEEKDELAARNTQLMADNRRLRLALGHARPLLAMAPALGEEA